MGTHLSIAEDERCLAEDIRREPEEEAPEEGKNPRVHRDEGDFYSLKQGVDGREFDCTGA